MPREQELTVHALQLGKAMCGFSDLLYTEWPSGHGWTIVGDLRRITCQACREKARAATSPLRNDAAAVTHQ